MLLVASGCDKAKAFLRAGETAGPAHIPPGAELNLATNPTIIFQVFGETGDARMIPVAAVADGKLRPILLTPANWQRFDATYLRAGKSYALFQDGETVGSVEVKQGMWEHPGQALYALPGCRELMPIAAVRVNAARLRSNFTLEFIASNGTLGKDRPPQPMASGDISRAARSVAAQVAQSAGISPSLLDSLDFHAVAFASGATRWPTVVASFIDPSAENAGGAGAHTTHLLIVANRDSAGVWRPTFAHKVNGPLAGAAFRRYFGHLDLTGDAVDEIILEGWQFGGDTFMTVLGWKNGAWREVFTARSSWCLDERASN
jgi:hypothetical protein